MRVATPPGTYWIFYINIFCLAKKNIYKNKIKFKKKKICKNKIKLK